MASGTSVPSFIDHADVHRLYNGLRVPGVPVLPTDIGEHVGHPTVGPGWIMRIPGPRLADTPTADAYCLFNRARRAYFWARSLDEATRTATEFFGATELAWVAPPKPYDPRDPECAAEPWRHLYKRDTHKVKRDKEGRILGQVTVPFYDYARACECVNALSGVVNPADFVEAARRVILAAEHKTGLEDALGWLRELALDRLDRIPPMRE